MSYTFSGRPVLALLLTASAIACCSCQKNASDPFGDRSGFKPVTNGRDLEGWKMQGAGRWTFEEGEVVGRQVPGATEDSWLFTSAEWSDFALELAFMVPEKCNSGVGIRMPEDSTGAPDVHGFEVQISDLPQRKLTGSLLHHIESTGKNHLHPDEWNRLGIVCERDHIRVFLNGEKVLDSDVKGSLKGRIGLQVPFDPEFSKQIVRFRNIRIKDL